MKQNVMSLLFIFVTLYSGACAYLYFAQRSMLYYPTPASVIPSTSLQRFEVDGVELYVSANARTSDDALIYFGGNAEDVSMSLSTFSEAFPDHAIYMLHYRGYGGSAGSPTEAALHTDALALYERVASKHTKIAVIGRSLGSGVAIRLAAHRPVSSIVLVTPYDSIANVAQRGFRFLPVKLLIKDRYESWRYAPNIEAPTLLIAAQFDQVIPRESTDALFKHFNQDIVKLLVLDNVGHNDLSNDPGYMKAMQQHL